MSRRSSALGIPSSHPLSRSPSSSSSAASAPGHNTTPVGSTGRSIMSHSRRTTLDSLVPLQPAVDVLLAEKERECEQLLDQVDALKRQLASRPPKSEIEALTTEFRIQESLLSGFQRENEKAMRDLERARLRERLLEGELEKLLGPNWAMSLNLTSVSSSSPHSSPSLSHASPRAIFPSPASTLGPSSAATMQGSANMHRVGSTPLSSSFVPSWEASFQSADDDVEGAADDEDPDASLASSGDEVEGAIFSPVKKPHPTQPSRSLNPASRAAPTSLPPIQASASDPDPAQTRREVEAVRMLLRGMEGRLTSREEELQALVLKAEREAAAWRGRGLPV